MNYKGKECCQGCKKTGTEMPRANKEDLCRSCKDLLELGRAQEKDKFSKENYTFIFQHYHAFTTKYVNDLIHKILAALDNPHIIGLGAVQSIKDATGGNGMYYRIPKNLVEPIRAFFKELNDIAYTLKKDEEQLPKKAREALITEKNIIFNEGMQKGRDLLAGLNSGETSLADFEKKIIKY